MSNFRNMAIKQRSGNIVLIKGADASGRAVFYFILANTIGTGLYPAKGSTNISDLGKILYTGFGTPSPAAFSLINKAYNCNFS